VDRTRDSIAHPGEKTVKIKFGFGLASISLWLCATLLSGAVYAQDNSIESVSSTQQGLTTILRINLKTPPNAMPGSFAVSNPPRVAFDFADTENKMGRTTVDLNQGDVRNVSVVQANKRSRVVLNLRKAMTFNTAVEGNAIVVTLSPGGAGDVLATPQPSVFSVAKTDLKVDHALRDIDFRRGKEGEGRIVIDLSDPQVAVDIKQQGSQIVVDFLRSKLPDNLRRRLDVSDFGTAVKFVRAFQQGDNARVVIEPQGLWEHNAYQSDNQFVVEVKAVKEDPNKLVQGTRQGYRGERLSLNFQNVDVRALLQVIADFTNLNIITSDSVAGSLTLRLKDVPWDQALDIVMQSKGLDMRKNGNVLLIAPRDELATKEKLELESKQSIIAIEPLKTEAFSLNYQKAEIIGKMLTTPSVGGGSSTSGDTAQQRMLSKRGSVVVDIRTNKLFVQDIPSSLDEVRKIIQLIDIPVRQVLIEARVVEADDKFSKNLGVKLGYNDLRSTIGRPSTTTDLSTGQLTNVTVPTYGAGRPTLGGFSTISGNLGGVRDLSGQSIAGTGTLGFGSPTAADNANFVNLPALGLGGNTPGSFAISLFGSSLSRFINLELSALEADQRGKIISSPRVLTADQGKAVIEQGTEIPFQVATSSGATSIIFKKATLRLEVTPQITPDGNVIMDVQVNRDQRGEQTTAGPAIDTRSVKTQVLVENGGTVVIGGVYEQFERNQVSKVPLLGDIPFLGNLFKNSRKTADRSELLIFLTPKIVTDTVATNK
jgi:type IV pilus assembly protein PilQ